MLEMLKVVEEKDNLFASSPIGATMQDGGKRKRSVLVTCLFIINKKKRNIKLRKIDKRKRKMLVSKYIITIVELKKVEQEGKTKFKQNIDDTILLGKSL